MTTRALLIAFAVGACTPSGALEPVDDEIEDPQPAICPVGLELLAAGLDASVPVAPATVRTSDLAVLVAFLPRGAPATGLSHEVSQRVDGDRWIAGDDQAIDACGPGAHTALTPHDLSTSGPPLTDARGRLLLRSCGGRADAPARTTIVDPSSHPATWLTAGCADDAWLWLWTARSCAQISARFPGAPGGLYTIDPDGPGGEPPVKAFCDQQTLGGGWTQVLGVDDAGLDTSPTILRPESLRDGLESAGARQGYVRSTLLASFPARGAFLEFRFYCRRESGARLHVVTTQADVARFLTNAGAPSPPAQQSFFLVDVTMQRDAELYAGGFDDTSKLSGAPQLWGRDVECGSCDEFGCGECTGIGRWGESRLTVDADDRIANRPMSMERDSTQDLARGFRAIPEVRECDGGDNQRPGVWLVFVR